MSARDSASTERDAMAEIVRYNRQFLGVSRDPGLIADKLEKLCAGPFGFFRGTYHLFVSDWLASDDRPVWVGAPRPIVGDIHLENFGAYRAADGRAVFDVNDFDEVAVGTPVFDLARMATSLLLADASASESRGVERIGSFLEAWHVALADGDCAAIDGAPDCRPVRELLKTATEGGRSAWLDKRVETVSTRRRFKQSESYRRVSEPRLLAAITAGVRVFGSNSDCATGDGWPELLDVATRVAGTGSLGRFRWAVLIAGKSQKSGRERVLELKEARAPCLEPHEQGDPAEHVTCLQRALQGAPPKYLGAAHVDVGRLHVACSVRELQPSEAKLDTAKLKHDDFDSLAVASGTALGRLHARAGHKLPADSSSRKLLAHATATFALRYAQLVVSDQKRLRKQKEAVAHALGLPTAG